MLCLTDNKFAVNSVSETQREIIALSSWVYFFCPIFCQISLSFFCSLSFLVTFLREFAWIKFRTVNGVE
jgi:hypothetical protein